MTLALRPVTPADRDFLLRLYASTRAPELAPLPWSDVQKAAFIAQQFAAQDAYWRAHYTDTSWDVVELDGEPVGRLYVARWPAELRVVDVAILPAHRNAGLGERLLRAVLDEGRASGRPVTIHVERFNPARRLYARLGFAPIGDRGVYLLAEWRADVVHAPDALAAAWERAVAPPAQVNTAS